MDSLDLLIEIDLFISRSELTHEDSIKALTDALAKEIIED